MGIFDDVPMVGQGAAPSSGGLFDDVPVVEEKSFIDSVVDFGSDVVDFGEEAGRGIITAPVSLLQGLTELGAAGLDFTFGTNTSRPVTEAFESLKSGIKPETGVGQAVEDITAFGLGFIPIAGWLGRASLAAKTAQAGKTVIPSTSRFLRTAENFGKSARGQKLLSTRAGLIGTTAAAAAGYETVFTPDGRVTLSDTFDLGGPLQTEADTGLTGREAALRRIKNKLVSLARHSTPRSWALALGLGPLAAPRLARPLRAASAQASTFWAPLPVSSPGQSMSAGLARSI